MEGQARRGSNGFLGAGRARKRMDQKWEKGQDRQGYERGTRR